MPNGALHVAEESSTGSLLPESRFGSFQVSNTTPRGIGPEQALLATRVRGGPEGSVVDDEVEPEAGRGCAVVELVELLESAGVGNRSPRVMSPAVPEWLIRAGRERSPRDGGAKDLRADIGRPPDLERNEILAAAGLPPEIRVEAEQLFSGRRHRQLGAGVAAGVGSRWGGGGRRARGLQEPATAARNRGAGRTDNVGQDNHSTQQPRTCTERRTGTGPKKSRCPSSLGAAPKPQYHPPPGYGRQGPERA